MASTSSWSQRTKSPGGALPSHGVHGVPGVHAPPRLGRSASLQSLPASLGSKSTGPERLELLGAIEIFCDLVDGGWVKR